MAEHRKVQVGVIKGRFSTKDMPDTVRKLLLFIQERCSTELIMDAWRKAHREVKGYDSMVGDSVEKLVENMDVEDARSFLHQYQLELHFSAQMLPGNFAVAMETFFSVISAYRREIRYPGMMYCLRAKNSAKVCHFFTGIYNQSHRGVEHTTPQGLLACPLYKEYQVGKIFGGIAQVVEDSSYQ
ncbi:hypothetical protein SM033_00012 [Vibrio phage vB_VpaM_sm033]|nr:hypothetical protein SM033_00012 [Vibrio phage vB_VpaM_sm033]